MRVRVRVSAQIGPRVGEVAFVGVGRAALESPEHDEELGPDGSLDVIEEEVY